VTTAEGLARDGELHPVQAAFRQNHGLQCGFCTPGMVMVLKNYLQENPAPTRDDIRTAIAGNLCRCTGYQHIIDAGMQAAEQLREDSVQLRHA
jgi:carbon-monoxide dehydrogenase small subunit